MRKELIFNLLYKILREQGEEIRGLYERNDVKIRLLEGMEENKGWFAFAEAAEPGEPLTEIVENGIRYNVDVENGQKTGFFLDQKYNRQAIAKNCQRQACTGLLYPYGCVCPECGGRRRWLL